MLDATERQAGAEEDQALVLWSQQLARRKQSERQEAEATRQTGAQMRAWEIEKREEEMREAKEELAELDKALDDPQMSESGKVLIRPHRDKLERQAKYSQRGNRRIFKSSRNISTLGNETTSALTEQSCPRLSLANVFSKLAMQ
jgi:hypothetical protein